MTLSEDRRAEETLRPESLSDLVYRELRAVASRCLQGERRSQTLQTTALVHEAYVQLAQQRSVLSNRDQFMALASTIVRRVLVDHARRTRARKRGGEWNKVVLDDEVALVDGPAVDVIDLNDALKKLTDEDATQGRIVELRFFGGLTADEIARLLRCSRRKVQLEWRMARAWLRRELEGSGLP